jgi:hypothetical protein
MRVVKQRRASFCFSFSFWGKGLGSYPHFPKQQKLSCFSFRECRWFSIWLRLVGFLGRPEASLAPAPAPIRARSFTDRPHMSFDSEAAKEQRPN